MVSITIPSRRQASRVRRAWPPAVFVGRRRRYDLHVRSWLAQDGPEFGELTLVHAWARAGQSWALPPLGQSVRVTFGGGVFDGVVVEHRAELGDGVDAAAALLRPVLWDALRRPVTGRWQLWQAALLWDEAAPVAFNARDGLACTAEQHLRLRRVRVFADEGQPWSVADMLRYLLAAHLPAGIAATAPAELDRLAGDVYPGPLDVTGLPLREALARVAAAGGLRVHSGAENGRRLVIAAPGGGRRRRLVLGRAGQSVAAGPSNVQGATVRFQPARRGPIIALGEPPVYEVTLELQPAWPADRQSPYYGDFLRARADNWSEVSEVYRKWSLNESGRYRAAPYHLPAFDARTIDAEAFFLPRGRALGPCLSDDAAGLSRGVLVEVSLDAAQTWQPYEGAVLLAGQECTVYLPDQALGGAYFHAAVEGLARLRVTGTITGDARLRVERPGDPREPTRLVRLPGATRHIIHAGSVFAGGLSRCVRDDGPRLEAFARAQQVWAGGTEAQVHLAWADGQFHVGDCVQTLAGRAIPLTGGPGGGRIERLEHRFGTDWTTHLHIKG